MSHTMILDGPARGANRPAFAADLPTVPRLTFGRVAAVELRKMVDTRAGRWLLGLLAVLAVAGAGWHLTHLSGGVASFDNTVNAALTGVILITPVLGVLAMTTEWTQRTALTTFTLTPRRGQVLTAKLLGALVLTVLASVFTLAVAAGGMVLTSVASNTSLDWSSWPKTAGGLLLATVLNTLMGASFGALLGHTAAGVTWFYVAPNLVGAAASGLLKSGSDWISFYETLGRSTTFDFGGHLPQTATTLAIWIVLPLTAGLIRCLRRNVS